MEKFEGRTRLTREETAEYLGCKIWKLDEMTRQGKLNGCFFNIGIRKLYLVDKLEEWISNGGEGQPWKEAN